MIIFDLIWCFLSKISRYCDVKSTIIQTQCADSCNARFQHVSIMSRRLLEYETARTTQSMSMSVVQWIMRCIFCIIMYFYRFAVNKVAQCTHYGSTTRTTGVQYPQNWLGVILLCVSNVKIWNVRIGDRSIKYSQECKLSSGNCCLAMFQSDGTACIDQNC